MQKLFQHIKIPQKMSAPNRSRLQQLCNFSFLCINIIIKRLVQVKDTTFELNSPYFTSQKTNQMSNNESLRKYHSLQSEKQVSTKVDDEQKVEEQHIELPPKKIRSLIIDPQLTINYGRKWDHHSQICSSNFITPEQHFQSLKEQPIQNQLQQELYFQESLLLHSLNQITGVLDNTTPINQSIQQFNNHKQQDNSSLEDQIEEISCSINDGIIISCKFIDEEQESEDKLQSSLINIKQQNSFIQNRIYQTDFTSQDSQMECQNSNYQLKSQSSKSYNQQQYDNQSLFDPDGSENINTSILSTQNNFEVSSHRFLIILNQYQNTSQPQVGLVKNSQDIYLTYKRNNQTRTISIAVQQTDLIVIDNAIKDHLTDQGFDELLLSCNQDQFNRFSYQQVNFQPHETAKKISVDPAKFKAFKLDGSANAMTLMNHKPQQRPCEQNQLKNLPQIQPDDDVWTKEDIFSASVGQFLQIEPKR